MAHHNRKRWPRILVHRGVRRERVEFNQREAAFAAEWERENEIRPGINFGRGTLQGLFQTRHDFGGAITSLIINNRDAYIVASVVQWLGSNCGMDFLTRALRACGYTIAPDREWREAIDCCGTCGGRGKVTARHGSLACGWCGSRLSPRMLAAIRAVRLGDSDEEKRAA